MFLDASTATLAILGRCLHLSRVQQSRGNNDRKRRAMQGTENAQPAVAVEILGAHATGIFPSRWRGIASQITANFPLKIVAPLGGKKNLSKSRNSTAKCLSFRVPYIRE